MLDKKQLAVWQKNWRFKSRKTSDRVLIYAQNNGQFLLIFILSELDAHKIALMQTQQDKEIMQGFATVAEAFIFDGLILA